MEVSITEKLDEKNSKIIPSFRHSFFFHSFISLFKRTHILHDTSRHFALYSGRELGKYAVWSLSTAKPGNGIEQLRGMYFF